MSSEVGSAHISIFPVMTGFRSKVNKEVKSTGDEASNSFKSAFRNAGGISGRQLGKQLKESFAASSKGLAGDALKVFTDDVKAATNELSKARMKQADDAGRVRVAEMRLQDAIAKYGEGSTQAVAAEERLASARRKSEQSAAAVKDATEKLNIANEFAAKAQQDLAQYTNQSSNAFARAAKNFLAGAKSLDAGKSSATGMAGALGSLVRAASGIDMWGPIAAKATAGLAKVKASIADFASSAKNRMQIAAAEIGNAISDGLSRAGSKVQAVVSNIASRLPQPIKSVCSTAHTWFSNIGTAAKSAFDKLPDIAKTGIEGAKSAVSAGMSAIGSICSSAASAFKNISTAIVGVGAGATLALGKLAATGGFNRALSIEDARAKLKGLGHDAGSIDEIMNNALASVKGTAYGLGDAATTASQLVASGVKQGDQLTSVLKTVGDSAQISGRDFTEMGSIFSKVAASNKLQGEQVNQILDSGIPILQFLAKHYGITAEEAQKMVSSGKVDFENFAAAMQENLGGAAQSAGTTFKGAMANVKAAFSRLGEKAMTPVLNGLRDIFNAAIPLVDAVTTKLTPVFEQWGDLVSNTIAPMIVDAFEKITSVLSGDSFSGFSSGIMAAIPLVGSLVAAMGGTGLLGTIGELLVNVPMVGPALKGLVGESALLGNALKLLGGPVGVVLSLLAGLVMISPTLQQTLSQVAGTIGSSLMDAFSTLAPIAQDILGKLSQAASEIFPVLEDCLGQLFSAIGNVVAQLAPVAAEILQPLLDCISQLIEPLTNILTVILPPLTSILDGVIVLIGSVLSFVGQLVAGIESLLLPIITAVIQGISDLLTKCSPWLDQLGSTFETVMDLIGDALEVVGSALNQFMSVAGYVIEQVVQFLVSTLEPAFAAMAPFISGIVASVNQVISSIAQIVQGVVNLVAGLISGNWSQVWQSCQQIASGAVGALGGILSGIYNAAMAAVSGAGTWLWNAGSQIIAGLWNGISGAIGGLYNNIRNALSGLVDEAMSALGIHSPSRVFRDKVGKFIPSGIGVGIKRNTPALLSDADRMTDALVDRVSGASTAVDVAAGMSIGTSANGAQGASGGAGGLSVDDIVLAIVTALSKIGALKLDVDLKTLAMLLAPSIDSELGKRDAMEV